MLVNGVPLITKANETEQNRVHLPWDIMYKPGAGVTKAKFVDSSHIEIFAGTEIVC